MFSTQWRYGWLQLVPILLVFQLACNSSLVSEPRKPTYPVSGKVMVSGKPATGAMLVLVPLNEAPEPTDPRPRAEVMEDGGFTLTTYDTNDGAPAGEYIVTIHWPGGVLPDGSEEPPDKLLGRYIDAKKSELRAVIKEGTNQLTPYELKL